MSKKITPEAKDLIIQLYNSKLYSFLDISNQTGYTLAQVKNLVYSNPNLTCRKTCSLCAFVKSLNGKQYEFCKTFGAFTEERRRHIYQYIWDTRHKPIPTGRREPGKSQENLHHGGNPSRGFDQLPGRDVRQGQGKTCSGNSYGFGDPGKIICSQEVFRERNEEPGNSTHDCQEGNNAPGDLERLLASLDTCSGGSVGDFPGGHWSDWQPPVEQFESVPNNVYDFQTDLFDGMLEDVCGRDQPRPGGLSPTTATAFGDNSESN